MHPLYLLTMYASVIFVIVLLAAVAWLSVKAHKLTPMAGLTGFAVAGIIYAGAGINGVILLALFFILGVAASKWKSGSKYTNVAQDTSEARLPGQVLANGGVAALMAIVALLFTHQAPVFKLMLAGSIASATADTISSELGIIYGTRFFNCINLKKDTRGLDGVISFEGTLLGLTGALLIAVAATYPDVITHYKTTLIITIAGATGNYADSVLGATLERRGLIDNNTVNFLSTLIAAASVIVMLGLTA